MNTLRVTLMDISKQIAKKKKQEARSRIDPTWQTLEGIIADNINGNRKHPHRIMHAASEFFPEIILVSLPLANTKLGRSGTCTDGIQTKILDNLDGRHACSGSVREPRYRVGNAVPRSCSGGLGV